VLVGGLVLELVNAAIWYKGLETFAGMAAVLLIVGGVWGEVFFGQRARIAGDKQLAQYEMRAAEARAAAARAVLELEQLKRPRAFNVERFKEILDDSRALRGKVEILYVRECSDCAFLAAFMRGAFTAAKWPVVRYDALPEPTGDKAHLPAAMAVKAMPYGVTVVSKNTGFLHWENSLSGDVHFAICHAMGTLSGVTGQTDQELPEDLIRVVIAPRP
jgi:hypothetical protein